MDLDTSDESSESPEEGELKVGMGVYEFEDQTIKIEIQDAILLPNQFFAVQNRILHILSDLTYSPQGFAVSSVQVYLQTLLCVFGRDRMGGKSVRKDETTTQVFLFLLFLLLLWILNTILGLFFTSYLPDKGALWQSNSLVTP